MLIRGYNGGLGDTDDPRSRAYADEQLHIATEQKLATAWNALTPEAQKAAIDATEKARQAATLKNVNMLVLNNGTVAKLPLSATEEKFRRAIVAGDWKAASAITWIDPFHFPADVSLGKYRFNIVNGQKVYKPWTRSDYENYIAEFGRVSGTGYSPLVEPGRDFYSCDWSHIIDKNMEGQAAYAKMYPASDPRHVYPIFPAQYLCRVYRPSTWVKIRTPVTVAVGVALAIYFGPAVVDKMASMFAKETAAAQVASAGTNAGTAAAEVAAKSSFLSKVQSGVEIYNKANTVIAIAKGELPPPPIGISGATFTEWALDIAKKEMKDAIMSKAGEAISEKIADEMIAKEEAKMRAEIEALQRELDKIIPPNTPTQINPALNPTIKKDLTAMQNIERKDNADFSALALIAVPALFYLLG